MSILVVLIPPRARVRARAADGAEADSLSSGRELHYVLSDDGFNLDSQGRCAAALLPRAQPRTDPAASVSPAIARPKAASGAPGGRIVSIRPR